MSISEYWIEFNFWLAFIRFQYLRSRSKNKMAALSTKNNLLCLFFCCVSLQFNEINFTLGQILYVGFISSLQHLFGSLELGIPKLNNRCLVSTTGMEILSNVIRYSRSMTDFCFVVEFTQFSHWMGIYSPCTACYGIFPMVLGCSYEPMLHRDFV